MPALQLSSRGLKFVVSWLWFRLVVFPGAAERCLAQSQVWYLCMATKTGSGSAVFVRTVVMVSPCRPRSHLYSIPRAPEVSFTKHNHIQLTFPEITGPWSQ